MLTMLQSMYARVRSCVRCPNNLTEFVDCPSGVRQGCVLSPTLSSFLINEQAVEMAQKGMHGVQLTPDVIQVHIMLFADDVFLASYCVRGLQKQIDVLKEFADNSSMTVNLNKTKIVIFRKGGFISAKEVWWYGANTIEVVNSYKYLGLHFNTKLSLTQMTGEFASEAKSRIAQISKCLRRMENVQEMCFSR